MPTILHEKDYLHKQKLIYFFLTFASLVILIIFYIVYRIYNNVYFIILAGLSSIPIAQFGIRYILIFSHKDCNSKIADELSTLNLPCYIINTVLFTNGGQTKFIDNIIIIEDTIICIIDNSKKSSKGAIDVLNSMLKGYKFNLKVIDLNDYNFNNFNKYKNIKNSDENLFIALKCHLIWNVYLPLNFTNCS